MEREVIEVSILDRILMREPKQADGHRHAWTPSGGWVKAVFEETEYAVRVGNKRTLICAVCGAKKSEWMTEYDSSRLLLDWQGKVGK